MRNRTPHVILILFLIITSVCAEDQKFSEGWTDLSDEQPSRRDLFENVIKAALLEDSQKQTTPDAMTFAIPKEFFFPDDARFDKIQKKPRNNVIFGIDISHHDQGKFKFDMLLLQKVRFVYAKATQGVRFNDGKFADYWSMLGALPAEQKVFRGAYHFLSASDDAKAQAERFVQYVNLKGGFKGDDMPPCVDLEWDCKGTCSDRNPDQWKKQSPDKILASLTTWLKRVKELTGRTPLIYTARSWWRDRGIPEAKIDLLNDYPIWIADYSRSNKAAETPNVIKGRTQSLWQFADNAQLVAGYDGKLDASIFYGSEDQFARMFGIAR